MTFTNYLQCLRRMDSLISLKSTGCPSCFAGKLGISEATLYRYINYLKNLGAPIQYVKDRESYIYEFPFELNL
ncbi:MAG: HTH domain-containing protein [Saprospiraceae bacterium]|nr:HTH domain-containing protein [Saprospiraceae bacterium]